MWLRWAVIVLSLLASTNAPGLQPPAEFLLLPQITFDTESDEIDPQLDLFLTVNRPSWRFLGEYLLEEDPELERFQLGWVTKTSNAVLWVGRFHVPGYWNSRYHHGKYLQTTIENPAISDYEDDGGVLPAHITGLLFEGRNPLETGDLFYDVALGAGAELTGDAQGAELRAFDVLAPSEGAHDVAVSARLAYRSADQEDEWGLFGGYSRLPGHDIPIDEVRQSFYGLYGRLTWEQLRLVSLALRVDDTVDVAVGRDEGHFTSAYVQAEAISNEEWTPYLRLEHTWKPENDPYLAFFPEFTTQRHLIGLRCDFRSRQALKLELSYDGPAGDRHSELALQWSAVFQ